MGNFKLTDKHFDIHGQVSRRIRDGALKAYLEYQKTGAKVPQPLQDYINWGIQRVVDGEKKPYPVTKGEKHNPYVINVAVQMFMRAEGRTEEQAIKETASQLKMTERQVRDTYRRTMDNPPQGVLYYLQEIFEQIEDLEK